MTDNAVVPVAPVVDPVPPMPVKPQSFWDHLAGIGVTIGGIAIFAASHLAMIPSPIQPWVSLAGGVATLVGQLFHVKGLTGTVSQ